MTCEGLLDQATYADTPHVSFRHVSHIPKMYFYWFLEEFSRQILYGFSYIGMRLSLKDCGL